MEDLAPKLFAKILRIPAPMLPFFFGGSPFNSLLVTGFADRFFNIGTLNKAGPEAFRMRRSKSGLILAGLECECWRRKRVIVLCGFSLSASSAKVLLLEDIILDQD